MENKSTRMSWPRITLILGLFFLMLFVGVVEGLIRVGRIKPVFFMRGLDYVLDEEVLFRILPSRQMGINSLGYRDREFVPQKDKPRILIAGDSFAMGTGLADNETISYRLEQNLGGKIEFYNMGINGYGPDQSLVRLMEDGIPMSPYAVILVLFPANDLNDLIKNNMFNIDKNGKLIKTGRNVVQADIGPVKAHYLYRFLKYKYFGEDTFENIFDALVIDSFDVDFNRDSDSELSTRKKALMRAVLREYKRVLDDRGIRFIVTVVPSCNEGCNGGVNWTFEGDDFKTEDAAMNIALEEGIETIDLREVFRAASQQPLYNNVDNHLSPFGAYVTSVAIIRSLASGKKPDQGWIEE